MVRGFKNCGLSTNVNGSENQEVHIEKIPNYQMPLDDDEFNEEYTSDDGVKGDDGDEDDYVDNGSGTEENVDSELRSNACSDNYSIYGMLAIRFTLAKCMKKHLQKSYIFSKVVDQ